MKFGHALEERERNGPTRYRTLYISYKRLKKILKEGKAGARVTASRLFLAELEREIGRINTVVLDEQLEIGALQREAVRLRESLMTPRSRVACEGALWKRTSELRAFVETAYETVYKAVKKHDKQTGLELMDQVLSATDRQPFMAILEAARQPQISPLLQQQSDLLADPPAGCPSPVASAATAGGVGLHDDIIGQCAPDAPLLAHPDVAAAMQAEFEAALASTIHAASSALRIISPELQEGSADWAHRLTKLVAVSDAARARVAECAARPATTTVRQLRDVILGHKLELLRYIIKAIVRALEHVSPDGAAALELVLQAHYSFFAPAMRLGVRAPSTRRINEIATMRRRVATTDADSSIGHVFVEASAASAVTVSSSAAGQPPMLETCGEVGAATRDSSLPAWSSLDAATVSLDGTARGRLDVDESDGNLLASPLVHSRSLLLQRGSTHFVFPPAGASRLRSLVTSHNLSPRDYTPRSTRLRDAAASLPLWKQLGLYLLGVAPWESRTRDASDATLLTSGDPVGQRETVWTCATICRALWRVHRPASMRWIPEYSIRKHLLGDVVAGLTIGIVLIPQGLAYATLAGLPPVYGLYTGLPAVVYAAFGSSSQAAIGPMSIPALLLAAGVSSMSPAPQGQEYIDAVLSISLLVGILLFFLGLFNMGFLVRFASRPVLLGFTIASVMLTIASTLKDLLGVPMTRSQEIYSYFPQIINALPHTNLPTLATGGMAIALLALLPRSRWTNRIPAPLQVVTLAITVFATWHAVAHAHVYGAGDPPPGGVYRNPAGIALVGYVPSSAPLPRLPGIPQANLPQLFATTFGVILVGFMESIAVAKLYAQKHGYEISASTELKALGLTNILGSLLGSFPVMGGFSRSSLSDNAGAKTPLNGAISAAVVLLLLFFVGPALYYLPASVLGALIVVAVAKQVDFRSARELWQRDKRDFITMLAALLATLLLGVLLGVVVAMGFSLIIFIGITTQPTVEELGHLQGTAIYSRVGLDGVSRVPDVLVLKFLAPMFFANCSVLKDRALAELQTREALPPRLQWRALVLSFASVTSIDSTSIQMLDEVVLQCHAAGLPVVLASPSIEVERALRSSGCIDRLGGASFIARRVHDAVRAVINGTVTLPHRLPSSAPAAISDAHRLPGVTLSVSTRLFNECWRLFLGRQPASPARPLRSALRPARERTNVSAATVVPLSFGDDDAAAVFPALAAVVPPSL